MAFTEDERVVPSDLQDIFHFKLKNNVYIDYIEITDRMLSINRTLTERIANLAINKMIDRLQFAYDNEFVTAKDFGGKVFVNFRNEVKARLLKTMTTRFKNKTDD